MTRFVNVLGSHLGHGPSMDRYTQLLVAAYKDAGVATRILRPPTKLSSSVSSKSIRKFLMYVECLLLFPFSLMTLRRDVPVHIADHSDSLWLLVPWLPKERTVTCHDLIAVRAARGELEHHKTRPSGRLYQWLVVKGLGKASLIACVSFATKEDVSRLVPGVTATVIHNPLDPATVASDAARTMVDEGPPYALLVSSSGWRKRRGHAVQIWSRLNTIEPELRLVVVGQALRSDESRALAEDWLIEPGRVDDPTLARLYAGASTVLQVGLYEGFGWPIVEANANGVVAVCSDLAVFHEVGADNIFVSDELDEVDWANVWSDVSDPERRERCRAARIRFSAERFQSELVSVLDQVSTS